MFTISTGYSQVDIDKKNNLFERRKLTRKKFRVEEAKRFYCGKIFCLQLKNEFSA